MLGVVNETPVPNNVPPVKAEYQFIVPPLVVAAKESVPVPHLLAGVEVNIAGVVVTVATMDVLGDEVQPALVTST